MEENYKRIGRYHGYWHELVYLNNIFITYQDCSINDKKIDCYITFLNNQIGELAESLQDMSFSYSLIRTDLVWTYEVEKVYKFLDVGHPIGEKYFKALIDYGYLPKHLASIDNKNILKLFFDAYNFFENQETRKPVNISSILKKITAKS